MINDDVQTYLETATLKTQTLEKSLSQSLLHALWETLRVTGSFLI